MSFALHPLEGSPADSMWKAPYQDGKQNMRQALNSKAPLSRCQRFSYFLGGLSQCIPIANTAAYVAIRAFCSPNFWATHTPSWMLPGEWEIDFSDVNKKMPNSFPYPYLFLETFCTHSSS